MAELKHNLHHHGFFNSDIPGRTDKIKMSVPADSYIIPADVVSALGEGNSLAGAKLLESIFPAPPKSNFAAGGHVPIIVAGGEFHINPLVIKRIGGGDIKKGHKMLEDFVKSVRAANIKTTQKLPGPKK